MQKCLLVTYFVGSLCPYETSHSHVSKDQRKLLRNSLLLCMLRFHFFFFFVFWAPLCYLFINFFLVERLTDFFLF